MKPDIASFNKHVAGANIQAGLEKGMWGFHDSNTERPGWPYVIIWVQAAPKQGKPGKYYFRFTLDNYPSTPPNACPWDVEKNEPLKADNWPTGGEVTKSIFNHGWNPCALYTPLDRLAQPNHDNWKAELPGLWWLPTFRIEDYLHFIYRNLHSTDYAGS